MTQKSAKSTVSATDRLGFGIFIAAILHSLVILGVSFSNDANSQAASQKPIEVIIVNTRSEEEPEDATRIAQANQLASGSQDKAGQASNPVSAVSPIKSPGTAFSPQVESQAKSSEQAQEFITSLNSSFDAYKDPTTDIEKDSKQNSNKQQDIEKLTVAQLTSQIEQQEIQYAERPRVRHIDALAAKTAVEAEYIKKWIERVERVGNLNYPAEARINKLSGRLILNVVMTKHGNIHDLQVSESSGVKILDDAALTIVRMASPFDTFPTDMYNAYDHLDITRTWLFSSDGKLIQK